MQCITIKPNVRAKQVSCNGTVPIIRLHFDCFWDRQCQSLISLIFWFSLIVFRGCWSNSNIEKEWFLTLSVIMYDHGEFQYRKKLTTWTI